MILAMTIQLETEYKKNSVEIDEGLFEKIASGDMDAFATLYHLTDKAIFGFALSILKNKYDAEDVMQDTYLKVKKYAGFYQKQGKPMAWILTITKNLSLSKLKHVSNSHLDVAEQFGLAAEGDDYEKLENLMVLETLLSKLNDEERKVVVLHAQTGLKHKEIAELLDMSLSTVLSKYARAIKKMSKSLKDM